MLLLVYEPRSFHQPYFFLHSDLTMEEITLTPKERETRQVEVESLAKFPFLLLSYANPSTFLLV